MIPLVPKSKMNKIETEFAWLLEAKKRAGEILDYAFECVTFRLAERTTYTPDFMIIHHDHFEMIDIKARGEVKLMRRADGQMHKRQWSSKRDDAAVKIKVAAQMFPWMHWVYWYREADGRWTREPVRE